MKKLLILVGVGLTLTACDNHTVSSSASVSSDASQTTVTATQKVDGKVSKTALALSDYAMRASLGNNPDTAAYVTIKNNGPEADRLVSVTCDCAKSASLHTMTMKGTMMVMGAQKDGFVIGPGATLVFAPGGNHIMLEGLTSRLQDGDAQDVTLNFEKAGALTVTMPVSVTPLAKDTSMAGMKM